MTNLGKLKKRLMNKNVYEWADMLSDRPLEERCQYCICKYDNSCDWLNINRDECEKNIEKWLLGKCEDDEG